MCRDYYNNKPVRNIKIVSLANQMLDYVHGKIKVAI